MRNSVYLATLLLALAIYTANSYTVTLKDTYQGVSFLSKFDFFTDNDPTHGYVNYVNQSQAISEKLVTVNSDKSVYIGTDTKKIATGRGRDSVRLVSKATFNAGTLILADIAHMPAGCGTWPAFWMVGPNWPNSGEIDIIEGVNNAVANSMTLHTSSGCAMNASLASLMSGKWGANMYGQPSNNCYVNAPNQWANAGCGITGATGSYGSDFNNVKGGIYATLWTNNEIAVYFFERNAIPTDITNKKPDPTKWGKPVALFQIGNSLCPDSHFSDQQIVINLTYCGDWAGGVFSSMCPNRGTCNNYVAENPSAFTEAYWTINSITIYNVE